MKLLTFFTEKKNLVKLGCILQNEKNICQLLIWQSIDV